MNEGQHNDGRLHRLLHGVSSIFSKEPAAKQARAEGHAPGVEEIQEWLVKKVAEQLGVGTDELHVRTPLASYGLDSRAALSLSGALEDWLGRRLSPTLVWDYPTIEEMATHLAAGEGAPQP